jgi:ATP-binding cassette subfamily B protein
MCAIPVITALIGIGQNFLTSTVGNSAMADLRTQLFSHLQTMELAFFTATKTGHIQSRLANDVAGVRTVLTDTATSILSNSVTVAAALISMIILSWQLTILTLVLMPVFIVVQLRVGRRRQRLAKRTQESLSEMTAITEEALSVSGILLSKVFGRGAAEVDRYRVANAEQVRLQVKQAMTGRAFFAVVQTFFVITPAVLYLAAGFMLSAGTPLTTGTLVAFTTVQARLQMPLLQLMRVTLDVQTSLALFRRIFEYLDLTPAITEKPGAVELQNPVGSVEFRDVWFRYPNTSGWALRGINLLVEPGQLAAIVGPSGAGKTTATYLVPRFYDTTEGAVLLDGHDVRDLTFTSIAHTVGMVTQEPYLFHGTVRDNIAYARPKATQDEIERAARDANIHDRIMSFPDGYDTLTGERGYRLSGGEKQRLAIARVLLMDPSILILDEATSALDTETERLVQEALERATRNRTTIAIAHRLSTIRAADVIFTLEDGALVESGSPEDLLASGGLYARLHEEQFRPGASALSQG